MAVVVDDADAFETWLYLCADDVLTRMSARSQATVQQVTEWLLEQWAALPAQQRERIATYAPQRSIINGEAALYEPRRRAFALYLSSAVDQCPNPWGWSTVVDNALRRAFAAVSSFPEVRHATREQRVAVMLAALLRDTTCVEARDGEVVINTEPAANKALPVGALSATAHWALTRVDTCSFGLGGGDVLFFRVVVVERAVLLCYK